MGYLLDRVTGINLQAPLLFYEQMHLDFCFGFFFDRITALLELEFPFAKGMSVTSYNFHQLYLKFCVVYFLLMI